MESDYESLLRQVEKLNNFPSQHAFEILDLQKRRELRKKLRKLSVALEDHGDIVDRIVYSPSDVVAIRIAVELGLFKILVDSEKPKTSQELTKMTAGDETLLGRLLRYLAGIDAIAHAGPDSYVATTISKAFTTAKGISGSGLFVNCLIPSWTKLPKTLAESGYINPCDPLHCAFQTGLNSNDHVFEWFAKNPSVLNDFNVFISAQREGHEYWLDFYPFEQQIGNASQSNDDTTVLFVDIGGGLGHEIQEIRRRFPTLGGRMVLQDLPQTIEQITAGPAMEHMVHDFFTLQPVKGAHAYYFRNIFHDWPDEQCRSKSAFDVKKIHAL